MTAARAKAVSLAPDLSPSDRRPQEHSAIRRRDLNPTLAGC